MAGDSFRTLRAAAEGYYTEKRSRFLSFAIPVSAPEEAKEWIDTYRKRYYDARHVCWAYMLGAERTLFRSNDDGEPSSTAGKPILGQINAHELTNLLVIVVRYFGGIELGTSGLTVAYRTAAAAALAAAVTEERTVDEDLAIVFEYPHLNGVMRAVKETGARILAQHFEMTCRMTLRIRRGDAEALKKRLLKVETLRLEQREFKDSRI
ncbi:MAG: IMPACT family protein [Tannerella sp.]|jgi:uncharacterized YigZ family protein|nr:IMPACT family protein [Tannerella sp.]